MPLRIKTHRPHPVSAPHARSHNQRPSAAARGYGQRWRRYRLAFLADHPLCECGPDCCPQGCGRPALDVDHILRITGPDDPLFWEPSNHQALSHECHARKTARES